MCSAITPTTQKQQKKIEKNLQFKNFNFPGLFTPLGRGDNGQPPPCGLGQPYQADGLHFDLQRLGLRSGLGLAVREHASQRGPAEAEQSGPEFVELDRRGQAGRERHQEQRRQSSFGQGWILFVCLCVCSFSLSVYFCVCIYSV